MIRYGACHLCGKDAYYFVEGFDGKARPTCWHCYQYAAERSAANVMPPETLRRAGATQAFTNGWRA